MTEELRKKKKKVKELVKKEGIAVTAALDKVGLSASQYYSKPREKKATCLQTIVVPAASRARKVFALAVVGDIDDIKELVREFRGGNNS